MKEFYDNIIKKYNSNRELWSFVSSTIFSIIGIFVSIVTAIKTPNNIPIAVSIIGCQVFVIIMSIITYHTFQKNRHIVVEAEKQLEIIIKEKDINIEALKAQCNLSKSLSRRIIICQKSINKKINNYLTRICDESDQYFYRIFQMADKFEDNTKEAKLNKYLVERIEEEQKRYKTSLYDLYMRYISGVIDETVTIFKEYLKEKNISLDVAVALKLFNTTYTSSVDTKSLRIYTAFRDKNTYNNKQREIGQKIYSLDLNGDFHKCLSNESYIKNNISNSPDDYLNENYPDCLKYYNCTVVVPIICDYKAQKQIFGFLCCDVLNNSSEEVFDQNAANLLYSIALTIGIFFDSMNSSWEYIVENDDKDEEFLLYLFKKITQH